MDVREKLVELIESARYWGSNTSEEIADHLISNGVTVQEWVSVKDRLPQEDGSYLVTANYFGKNQCIDVLGFVRNRDCGAGDEKLFADAESRDLPINEEIKAKMLRTERNLWAYGLNGGRKI